MKKTLIVIAFALAAALAASAQLNLTFGDMPLVSTPSPLPNGYGGLNWTNIFYVDPNQWAGAGPGYKLGPMGASMRAQDVAFVGGKVCRLLQEYCYGTISSPGGPTAFQPISAMVAAGFSPTYVIVTAYNNGNYVGAASYPLAVQLQTLNFPSSWGAVTQLTFQTVNGGDLVFYNFQAYMLGG